MVMTSPADQMQRPGSSWRGKAYVQGNRAARLRRLQRAVSDLEFQIKKAASPDETRRLAVKLRDHCEGLRLVQQRD